MKTEKILMDILLDKKIYERSIVQSQDQDIVFEWDYVTKSIFHANIFEEKFNHNSNYKDFPSSSVASNLVHPDDLPAFYETYAAYDNGAVSSVGEFRMQSLATGVYEWYRSSSTAMTDKNGDTVKVLGILSNIDAHKKEALFAQNLAMRDGLTGIYNRIASEALITQYVKSSTSGGAMFIIDVDNFKGLNDTMGHQFGDSVLISISEALGKLFRKGDVVGRLGGDEFIIFMTGIDEKYNIKRRARDLVAAIKTPFEEQSSLVEISGSVGIAVFPKDGESFEALYQNADIALYRAKSYGKNRYTMYDINFALDNVERNEITSIEKHPDFSDDMGIASISDSIIFICDNSNQRLMFFNDATREAYQLTDDDLGKKCYHAFYHRSQPCESCHISELSFDKFSSCELEVCHLKKTLLLREKLIKWKGVTAQIAFATDITKIAEAHKLAIVQNSERQSSMDTMENLTTTLNAEIDKYRNLINKISDGIFEYNVAKDELTITVFDYQRYRLKSDVIFFKDAKANKFADASSIFFIEEPELSKLRAVFWGECEESFEIKLSTEDAKNWMLVTPCSTRDHFGVLTTVSGALKDVTKNHLD